MANGSLEVLRTQLTELNTALLAQRTADDGTLAARLGEALHGFQQSVSQALAQPRRVLLEVGGEVPASDGRRASVLGRMFGK